MSELELLPAWAALIVSLLLILGASIILIGALGLLRLRTFYQRIHGPAITVTLGAGSLLLASMLYFTVGQSRLVVHEVIITCFVLLTAPPSIATCARRRATAGRRRARCTPPRASDYAKKQRAPSARQALEQARILDHQPIGIGHDLGLERAGQALEPVAPGPQRGVGLARRRHARLWQRDVGDADFLALA